MSTTSHHDARIAKMIFASVYPHYVTKVEKKRQNQRRIKSSDYVAHRINETEIDVLIREKVTFEYFFENATLNSNAQLIRGVICGYRIEEIENPLTQKVRCLDKLVDELARGRKMEKILRMPQK